MDVNNSSLDNNSKEPYKFLTYALKYIEKGLCIIPLKPKEKEPLIAWSKYKTEKPKIEEVKQWFSNGNNNIGIVCGEVSNNLVVIDFDNQELFEKWYDNLPLEWKYKINNTWIVKTNRGRHIYLRIDTNDFDKFENKEKIGSIEIIYKMYVVAPPSLHPKGGIYEFWNNWEEIDILHLDLIQWEELKQTLNLEKKEKELKELNDNQLNQLFELLKEHYKPLQRELLAMYLSAMFIKAGISKESLIKLANKLAEYDRDVNQSKDWQDTLKRFKHQINHHYKKEELEKLKGKSGLYELLEKQIGEQKALNTIRQIEEIIGDVSPFEEDPIIAVLSYNPMKFAIANMKKKIVVRGYLDKDNNIIYAEKVLDASPKEIYVYYSPFGASTKFRIIFQTIHGKIIDTGAVLFNEIIERLKGEGLVISKNLVNDVLSAIINMAIAKGRAIIKTEIEKMGFYIINDKLTPIKVEIKEVSKEELRGALLLLNNLVENWFNHCKDRFITALKWGVISPFIFARKQLGRDYQVPHLVLYGERDTGKTTIAEIISLYLWNLDQGQGLKLEEKHETTGSSANSEARLGVVISQDTFPKVINEANSLFYYPNVINILKNSVDEKIARSKFHQGEYKEYEALNPLIITLNPKPPVDFESLELIPKTCYLLRFSQGDVLKAERKEQFQKEISNKLRKLGVIGYAISKIMLSKNVEELKKPWIELSKEILIELYKEANLEIPNWIDELYTPPSFEDILSNKIEEIRSKLTKYVNEMYSKNIHRISASTGENVQFLDREDVSLEQKVDVLISNRLIPFIIPIENKLCITRTIISELNLEIESIKSLAEILEWEYRDRQSVRFGDKVTSYSVIITSKEKIIQLLKPQFSPE